ncbi:hypothetical protein TIFTF001_020893 [Ficus carica]|uniref:Uncharacterized protein n=1 Tax=Ficus carica TaxID=3494 RepID=A0AA88AEN6_FICCA|nr:hypothetical protein TIFTF001_020893 [Ficus carica]
MAWVSFASQSPAMLPWPPHCLLGDGINDLAKWGSTIFHLVDQGRGQI